MEPAVVFMLGLIIFALIVGAFLLIGGPKQTSYRRP
jgi:hypothetical protein